MKDFNKHVEKMAQHLTMSEEAIYNMFLDTADEYLISYAGTKNAANIWKATPEFWGWWKQVWLNRDNMVLRRYPERIRAHNRQQLYKIWHDPQFIHMTPNSIVYDGFMRTMKEQNVLIKQTA